MAAMISEIENLIRSAVIERITAQIPRHVLSHFPTPLMRANRLTKTLGGTELWFKRDDLVSLVFPDNSQL
jgi:1-aminocyclopropane-1-carboxylate deaminase/D-cysteine desulfhydrase-like pyridoxal-dependent ACC family enzyme